MIISKNIGEKKMKALIVIDVQEGIIEKYNKELILSINNEVEAFSKTSNRVIYIKNVFHLKKGIKNIPLSKDLHILSNNIFEKKQASAMTNQDLLAFLKQKEIDEVTLIGIDGNICVAATAKEAIKKGLQVVLKLNAIGIRNDKAFLKTKKQLLDLGVQLE